MMEKASMKIAGKSNNTKIASKSIVMKKVMEKIQ